MSGRLVSAAYLIACLALFAAILLQVESAKNDRHSSRRKSKPPLLTGETSRRKPRQTHCHFGNQTYELEEKWMPNLGPPFGVLYCVRCECVKTQRKKRTVARTRCENIKNICPKPTCDTPVLLPERCCKTCPGEDNAAIEEDLAMRKLEIDDDERNTKEYSVLLTGRGLTPTQPVSGAGRAYLTSFKRHVHYTIYFSGLERPRFVRFLTEDGNIIEEHEIANPILHVNESKVCGVWRKVPKIYRQLFPKERLSLELSSETYPNGIVGGKILRNMRINKEVFSSLLIPGSPKSKETLGGGGIAIIYTEGNSIYLHLEFNGIFLLTDSLRVPVYVQLMNTTDESKPHAVESSVVWIPKVHPEYNAISAKMDLDQDAQLLLYSGHLSLRLSAKDDAMFLFGKITIKETCNVFQATMTLENMHGQPPTPPASILEGGFGPPMTSNPWSNSRSPVGTAVVIVRSDGSLGYSIESVDLPDQPVLITLDSQDPAKKDFRTLLTTNETFLTDNKVTGIFPKSSRNVQEVEMLLSGDLFVSMSTPRGPTWPRLSGRIRQRLYTDAFVNVSPLTLVPESNGTPSAVGQAWLSVDKDCVVHYAVYVAGLPIVDSPPNHDNEDKNRERHLLELREDSSVAIGTPQQRVLQRLNGEEAEDAQEQVDEFMLSRMKAGYVNLAVSLRSAKGKRVELKAKIVNVPIPVTCVSPTSTPGNNSSPNDPTNLIDEPLYNCIYDRQTFMDGSQWVSNTDICHMCSCRRGKVVCDTIVCPTPQCLNPVLRQGECCQICPGESPINRTNSATTTLSGKSLGCYFEGDQRFHLAGSRWHPYIPPFGFSRCAICTCDAELLKVECTRITCPKLACSIKDAIREHPMACCKICTNKDEDMLEIKEREEALRIEELKEAGGCSFRDQVYANGSSWSPIVESYGVEKCVVCHCKNKAISCKRKKCPKLNCPLDQRSDAPNGECCQRCLQPLETRSGGSVDRRVARRRKTRERRNQIKSKEEE